MPDDHAAARACVLARRIQPDVVIAARTSLARGQGALRAAGADRVVVDELATADRMAEAVIDALRATS